jgi:hypothetical protein
MNEVIEHPVKYAAAIKRNIIANAKKTWSANTPRAEDIEAALEAGRFYDDRGNMSYNNGFMGAIARAFDSFGKLTPAQCAAVLKGIDARVARKAEWASEKAVLDAKRTHVGTVGQKVTLTLTIAHVVILDSMYGTSYLYICEDVDQNVVIYKGNAAVFVFKADGDGLRGKGDSLTVTATVKEHGVRDGVKQTIIQRPKAA